MTSQKDEPFTVDGVTFYREEPTTEVIHQDATIFTFNHTTNDAAFWTEHENKEIFPVSIVEKGWGRDSPYRKQIDIDVGHPRWEMFEYTFPPEAMAPHLCNISIRHERAHWYADFSATHLALIVTERARDCIEELDPGMNYFFPMVITVRETGEPLPEKRYFWRPRRELKYNLPDPHGPLRKVPYRPSSPFGDTEVAWELTNNEKLRELVSNFPFWAMETNNFNFAMSSSVFKRLKAEKFTGLLEIEGESRRAAGFDHNRNIGHY